MSAPAFNEADHPRAAGGTFTTKSHAEADVDLPAGPLGHDDPAFGANRAMARFGLTSADCPGLAEAWESRYGNHPPLSDDGCRSMVLSLFEPDDLTEADRTALPGLTYLDVDDDFEDLACLSYVPGGSYPDVPLDAPGVTEAIEAVEAEHAARWRTEPDPERPDAPYLAGAPWHLLRDPESSRAANSLVRRCQDRVRQLGDPDADDQALDEFEDYLSGDRDELPSRSVPTWGNVLALTPECARTEREQIEHRQTERSRVQRLLTAAESVDDPELRAWLTGDDSPLVLDLRRRDAALEAHQRGPLGLRARIGAHRSVVTRRRTDLAAARELLARAEDTAWAAGFTGDPSKLPPRPHTGVS